MVCLSPAQLALTDHRFNLTRSSMRLSAAMRCRRCCLPPLMECWDSWEARKRMLTATALGLLVGWRWRARLCCSWLVPRLTRLTWPAGSWWQSPTASSWCMPRGAAACELHAATRCCTFSHTCLTPLNGPRPSPPVVVGRSGPCTLLVSPRQGLCVSSLCDSLGSMLQRVTSRPGAVRCRPAARRPAVLVIASARQEPQPPRIGAGENKPYPGPQHENITGQGSCARPHGRATEPQFSTGLGV